ncbi:MAG: polysaccharide deacetylase family protein [Halanaerobiales bacterium]
MKNINIRQVLYSILVLIFIAIPGLAEEVHRVSPGENIFQIAEKHGLTVSEIINHNNLHNPEDIYENQVIILPDNKQVGVYRVQSGDTLYAVSRKLSIPMSVLAEENNLTYQDSLYAKQPLSIPLRYRYPQTYQVKAGESIYKIAKHYKISTEEIIIFNNLSNYNLEVNQELKIPVLKPAKPKQGPNYQAKYPSTFFNRGKSYINQIALTFDDGPDSYYTERVLEILKDHDVPATFFVVGYTIDKYPDVVKKIVEDGHMIANHSWDHPNLAKLSREELKKQIKYTEEAIEEKTGLKVRFLRPPWGFVSDNLLQYAEEIDYKIVNWNVDSIDWRDQDVDQILINTIPNINNDSIILFHSAGGRNQNLDATIGVLPELIETLKMNGYTFVTVDKLIQTPPYEIEM